MTIAYGKLYMKDASGSIVQIVPESFMDSLANSETVTHGSKTVSTVLQEIDSSIDGLEESLAAVANNGFKSVTGEVVAKSTTSSENVHFVRDGWVGSSVSSSPFAITVKFGYDNNGSKASVTKTASSFTHPEGEGNDALDVHRALKSNIKHTCTLSLDSAQTFTALFIETSSNTATTLYNGRIVSGKYAVVGNETLSSSEYASWSLDDKYVATTFPAVGESIQFKFNAIYSNGAYKAVGDTDMFVKLTCNSETSYTLDFWWEYEEDSIVETSQRWKELKTTTVLPDDTTKVSETQIAGLLQGVGASYSDGFDYAYVSGNAGEVESVAQKSELEISKEDAAGTVATQAVKMKPSTIVSYTTSQSGIEIGDVVDGFVCGVDPSNLAAGGLYFEVESTVEVQE